MRAFVGDIDNVRAFLGKINAPTPIVEAVVALSVKNLTKSDLAVAVDKMLALYSGEVEFEVNIKEPRSLYWELFIFCYNDNLACLITWMLHFKRELDWYVEFNKRLEGILKWLN